MLVLSRRPGTEIEIDVPGVENTRISVRLVSVNGKQATIGISAPPAFRILRQELRIRDDNLKLADRLEREID